MHRKLRAEYVKLLRSVKDGEVYDSPPQTVQRYQKQHGITNFEIWAEQAQRTWVTLGKLQHFEEKHALRG